MKIKKRRQIVEFSTGDTVTIDELLKDDPEALRQLGDLRAWMREHEGEINFPQEKKTQGQKKMRQQLEDVRRDARFARKLKRITEVKPAYDVRDLHLLYAKYRWYFDSLRTFRKEHLLKNPGFRLRRSLCRQYGIEPILFDRLLSAFKENRLEGWDFDEASSSDTCVIETQKGSDQPEDIHEFHLRSVDGIEEEIYPVKIKIHRFASKRDILDFVEKNWAEIGSFLHEKRIRARKIPREITDFIWKHRNKKAKEIVPLLRERFPGRNLAYFEVNKILDEEKKRRGIK